MKSHHLLQVVFVQMTYLSSCVYFRWSRVNTAVDTAVTGTVVTWDHCKIQSSYYSIVKQSNKNYHIYIKYKKKTAVKNVTQNLEPYFYLIIDVWCTCKSPHLMSHCKGKWRVTLQEQVNLKDRETWVYRFSILEKKNITRIIPLTIPLLLLFSWFL